MRKIAFAVALLIAGPALADGPGPVTWVKSHGGGYPNCVQFMTNGGPTVYGVSNSVVRNPAIDDDRAALAFSRWFGAVLTFQTGPAITDCPATVVSAYGLQY